MKGGLVRAKIDYVLLLLSQSLPQINDISQVCQRHCLLVLFGLLNSVDNLVQVCYFFLYPALFHPLVKSSLHDFSSYTDTSTNVPCFGLCATHSTQTWCYVDNSRHILFSQILSCRILQSQCCSMNDSLWANVAETPCCHLPVNCNPHCVQLFVHLFGAIIRNH